MTKTCLLLFFLVSAWAAPLLQVTNPIPGQYIVVFKQNVTDAQVNQHLQYFSHLDPKKDQVQRVYNINNEFRGYAALLSDETLKKHLDIDIIAYVEPDQIVTAVACSVQRNAPWGLSRVSSSKSVVNDDYSYSSQGEGVDSFIIDTGILTSHSDFGGRAIFPNDANFVKDGKNTDCNGHGTHVAGTVGGSVYGIAKKTTLYAVKVLGCNGSGTNAGVIEGVDYVTKNKKRASVANMSLGGGKSTALNDAVARAVSAGVVFVVAAGNENQDACNVSPASASSAITVGATSVADKSGTNEDIRSSFSNYGQCVDIFAPGSLITSAWIGSNSATTTISGTSMASPHVAGVAARYLSENPKATPAQVKNALNSISQGGIDLSCTNNQCRLSPDRLLHYPCA